MGIIYLLAFRLVGERFLLKWPVTTHNEYSYQQSLHYSSNPLGAILKEHCSFDPLCCVLTESTGITRVGVMGYIILRCRIMVKNVHIH